MSEEIVKKEVRMVDFAAIQVENIEGEMEKADFSKSLGNLIYSNTKDLGEVDLARNIYRNGRVEISKEDKTAIEKYLEAFPAVVQEAIKSAMKF